MIIYQFNAPHPYDEVFSYIEKTVNAIGAKDWIYAKVWFTADGDDFMVVGGSD